MTARLEPLALQKAALAVVCIVSVAAITAETQGTQPAPPARTLVVTTQVKPDMVAAYQELIQKEALPAYKKAGVPFRWVFTHGPVGPGATFVSAQPITNYAQFDQGPLLCTAMGARGIQQVHRESFSR